MVDAQAPAGFSDSSLWEEAKAKGEAALKKLIGDALVGTSVTAVLIGAETASRTWVKYEIRESIARGNGLLGVRIHGIKNSAGQTDSSGAVPALLTSGGYPIYTWDRDNFGLWVEKAAVAAGKACLVHGRTSCVVCG